MGERLMSSWLSSFFFAKIFSIPRSTPQLDTLKTETETHLLGWLVEGRRGGGGRREGRRRRKKEAKVKRVGVSLRRRKLSLTLPLFAVSAVPRGELVLILSRARSCRVPVFCLPKGTEGGKQRGFEEWGEGVEEGSKKRRQQSMQRFDGPISLPTSSSSRSSFVALPVAYNTLLLSPSCVDEATTASDGRSEREKRETHLRSFPFKKKKTGRRHRRLRRPRRLSFDFDPPKNGLVLRRLHPRAHLRRALRPRAHARGGCVRCGAREELRPARRGAARTEEGRPGEF